MKKLLLSALMGTSIAQFAAAFDLTGTWSLSAGVSVAMTQKGEQTSNYNVDLKQQKLTTFTFNLNLDTIQTRDNFQMERLITFK